MRTRKNDKNDTPPSNQKFPLWLLLVIITLLVLAAYIILQYAKETNTTTKITNFSYKF